MSPRFGKPTARRDTEHRGPESARGAAIRLLARRDFSVAELRRSLLSRGVSAPAAEAAVDELLQEGALDDVRYAHSQVASRAGRGQGPMRIAAELRQAGLAQELIDAALAAGPDWQALARRVRSGRFGPAAPADWGEKARQARFLQYRGFSSDHIRSATGADPDPD
ncbi:MAG: regulatory protein RecX [Proteobacteria bacterium]|nr:regulatory protein RecX [Pseudomonadota bacterium]